MKINDYELKTQAPNALLKLKRALNSGATQALLALAASAPLATALFLTSGGFDQAAEEYARAQATLMLTKHSPDDPDEDKPTTLTLGAAPTGAIGFSGAVGMAGAKTLSASFSTLSIGEGEKTTLTLERPSGGNANEALTVKVKLTGDVNGLTHNGMMFATATNYRFEAEQGVFTRLETSVSQLSLDSGNVDDGSYGALPLGFNFEFYDVVYNQIYPTTNGVLGLMRDPHTHGSSVNESYVLNAIGPAILPLWDDLSNVSGEARAATLGAPGKRVFVFEVVGAEWNWLADGRVIDFQVRLYEESGIIEFVYNAGANYENPTAGSGANIGVAKSGTRYINLSDASAQPTARQNAFVNSIGARPANGQIYRFIPVMGELELTIPSGDKDTSFEFVAISDDRPGPATMVNLAFKPLASAYSAPPTALTLTLSDDDLGLMTSLSPAEITEGAAATLTVSAVKALVETATVTIALGGDIGRLNGFGAIEYEFEYETVAFERLPETMTLLLPLGSDALDDGVYKPFEFGFPFVFDGIAYERGAATTNGVLTFNRAWESAGGVYVNEYAATGRQFLSLQPTGDALTALSPALYPLWDDLGNAGAEVRAATLGSPGARVFVYEVIGARWTHDAMSPMGGAPSIDYQVRLYEGSGAIEYIYNVGDGYAQPAGDELGATIGWSASADRFLTLSDAGAAPSVSSERAAYQSAISAPPVKGQLYRFTPRERVVEITLPAGERPNYALRLATIDDQLANGAGSVSVNLSVLPAGGRISPSVYNLRVRDNDQPLSVEWSPFNAAYGTYANLYEGETFALTIGRKRAAAESASVNVRFYEGAAALDLPETVTLTIPPNKSSVTALWGTQDDDDLDEIVNFGLTAATNGYSLARSQFDFLLFIADDDAEAALRLAPATIYEGETSAIEYLNRSGALMSEVSFELSGDVDRLVGAPQTLQGFAARDIAAFERLLNAGGDAVLPPLQAVDDAMVNGTGTVTLTARLASSRFKLATEILTLTILDDEELLRARLSPSSIFEGETATLTVERARGAAARSFGEAVEIELVFEFSGGIVLAESPTKRVLTLTIPANETATRLTLTAIDNAAAGDDTTVELRLKALTAGFEFAENAILNLRDNDARLRAAFEPSSIDENEATSLRIMSDRPASETISVMVNFPPGASAVLKDSATNQLVAESLTLTIPPGFSSAKLMLVAANDDFPSAVQTLATTLTSQTAGAMFGSNPLTLNLTLTDSDVLLNAALSKRSIDEGEQATLTVSRPTATNSPVTVSVTLGGADPNGVSLSATTLTIPANQTGASIAITARGDDAIGADSSVDVRLRATTPGHGFSETSVSAMKTLALTDDDVTLKGAFSQLTLEEGETATLTISRSGGAIQRTLGAAVTTRVNLIGDISGLLSPNASVFDVVIPAGALSARVLFEAKEDRVAGVSSNLIATLSENHDGFAFEQTRFELNLPEDDAPLTLDMSKNALNEGEETTLTISRQADAISETATVLVAVGGDLNGVTLTSAFSTAPLESASFVLTIPPLLTGVTFVVSARNDDISGAASALALTLTSQTDGFGFRTETETRRIALRDRDFYLRATLPSATTEDLPVNLALTLPKPATDPVRVLITLKGDAERFENPRNFLVAIPAGATSHNAVIRPRDNDKFDYPARLTVALDILSPDYAHYAHAETYAPDFELVLTDDARVTLTPRLSASSARAGDSVVLTLEASEAAPETATFMVLIRENAGGAGASIANINAARSFTLYPGELTARESHTLTIIDGRGRGNGAAIISFVALEARNASPAGAVFRLAQSSLRLNLIAAVAPTSPPPPTIAPPRVTIKPAPVNPSDPAPDAILGAPVATPEFGGRFEGPGGAVVIIPRGAWDDYFGVSLTAAETPPADAAPNLGEFIPDALILDVNLWTRRGVEINLLKKAATVCLPMNEFILDAVDGDIGRLRFARYHDDAWMELTNELRQDEGLICARSQLFSEFALTATPRDWTDESERALSALLPQTGDGIVLPLWLSLTIVCASAAALVGAALLIRFAVARRKRS